MAASLSILVVEHDAPLARAIGAALRSRGHHVTHTTCAEEALVLDAHDVLVSSLELGAGMDGLALLADLRERGSSVRAILTAELPTLEDCRRAMRLGAAELLAKPFQVKELLDAVEAGDPSPALPTAQAAWTFRRTLRTEVETTERCVRELTAFALRCGIGPSTRARVASAAAEILENAMRHAYASGSGPASLEAELGERELVVRIADEGAGFRPSEVLAGPRRDPLESGLARASALAEDLRVDSAPGSGTRVELRFAAVRVSFDEGDVVDLSELDWFSPGMARRVLESLDRSRPETLFNLSPALAVSVGRLLTAPTQAESAQKALWS
jgi:CheY-like chemotaxis protein